MRQIIIVTRKQLFTCYKCLQKVKFFFEFFYNENFHIIHCGTTIVMSQTKLTNQKRDINACINDTFMMSMEKYDGNQKEIVREMKKCRMLILFVLW